VTHLGAIDLSIDAARCFRKGIASGHIEVRNQGVAAHIAYVGVADLQ
jgi:hypothetical protein